MFADEYRETEFTGTFNLHFEYNSLEKVIDSFLDEYFYCKLECEGNGPILYKAYCLYENAVDDDGYTEQVIGNWTGWDLIKIIKKYYQNNEDLILNLQ